MLEAGRMFASLVHHDMAQIFHPVPLVMARFSGLFSAQSEQGIYEPALSSWLANIAREERSRVAWFCFVSDISQAILLLSKYVLISTPSRQCYLVQVRSVIIETNSG